jgi:hypothetical protein
MYLKCILLIFSGLFFSNCSIYLGDYKEVYYYKYNDIPNLGTYTLVFNESIDSHANSKYLQFAQTIKNNLGELGFTESKDYHKSNYIVYYDYSVLNEKNIYKAILSIKFFDNKQTIDVFNEESVKVSKRNKMIFDSTSIMYSSEYLPNQSVTCLLNAIFKKQIMFNQKSININSKISKEELSIEKSDGIYYCLN